MQPIFWIYVCPKQNKNEVINIQIIEKLASKSVLVKTVSSLSDDSEINRICGAWETLCVAIWRTVAFTRSNKLISFVVDTENSIHRYLNKGYSKQKNRNKI